MGTTPLWGGVIRRFVAPRAANLSGGYVSGLGALEGKHPEAPVDELGTQALAKEGVVARHAGGLIQRIERGPQPLPEIGAAAREGIQEAKCLDGVANLEWRIMTPGGDRRLARKQVFFIFAVRGFKHQ